MSMLVPVRQFRAVCGNLPVRKDKLYSQIRLTDSSPLWQHTRSKLALVASSGYSCLLPGYSFTVAPLMSVWWRKSAAHKSNEQDGLATPRSGRGSARTVTVTLWYVERCVEAMKGLSDVYSDKCRPPQQCRFLVNYIIVLASHWCIRRHQYTVWSTHMMHDDHVLDLEQLLELRPTTGAHVCVRPRRESGGVTFDNFETTTFTTILLFTSSVFFSSLGYILKTSVANLSSSWQRRNNVGVGGKSCTERLFIN